MTDSLTEPDFTTLTDPIVPPTPASSVVVSPLQPRSADAIAGLLELPRPTAQQRDIIESAQAPALVIAGAGSGKTETMASRVLWLLANGHVRPGEILGLTFTRKAAGELSAGSGNASRN